MLFGLQYLEASSQDLIMCLLQCAAGHVPFSFFPLPVLFSGQLKFESYKKKDLFTRISKCMIFPLIVSFNIADIHQIYLLLDTSV